MFKVDRTAKELSNVPLGDFDDLRLICGEDQLTGSYRKSVGDIPSWSINVIDDTSETQGISGGFGRRAIYQNCRKDRIIDLPEANLQAIYQCAIDWLAGKKIISRLIELGDNSFWEQLLTEICRKTDVLSLNAHGSYVIQSVLELQNPHFDELICSQVRDHILPFSKHMYGKFVVMKCLESRSCMEPIVNELLIRQRLYHLARVLNGVCVVATTIKGTRQNNIALFRQIEGSLEQHMQNLNKDSVGKYVYKLLAED